jgi:2-oxoglutarate ferredoxin oxidoreductase subunit beta
VDYEPGTTTEVTMHDGSRILLRKLEEAYDPTNKIEAVKRLMQAHEKGEVLTGLFYIEPKKPDFLEMLHMTDYPLATLPESITKPPKSALDEVMESLK